MRLNEKQLERVRTSMRIAGYDDMRFEGKKLTKHEKKEIRQALRARGHSGKLTKKSLKDLNHMAGRVGHGDSFVLGSKSVGIKQAEKRLAKEGLPHGKVDGVLDKKSLQGIRQLIRREQDPRFDGSAYEQAYQNAFPTIGTNAQNPADASQSAEQILNGVQYRDRTIGVDALMDPSEVNDPNDVNSKSARYASAASAMRQNYGLEQNQLKRLSGTDQAAYQSVSQMLQQQNDPVAGLSLQKLLFDGKFNSDLAQRLGSVASGSAQLADGVNRGAFLADLVQECAVPAAIAQGPTASCGPTTIEQDLAMKDPAEYARLAIGIASPEGQVQLKGGMTLSREPGTVTDDGSGRSSVQRMLGSAMYEVTNGAADYSGPFDQHGSWGYAMSELRSQLEGKPMSFSILGSEANNRPAMAGIDQMLQANQEPIVQLVYGPQGQRHYLSVVGHSNGFVEMLNPNGRIERMSEEDFMQRLAEVHYDPSVVDSGLAQQMGYDGAQVPHGV